MPWDGAAADEAVEAEDAAAEDADAEPLAAGVDAELLAAADALADLLPAVDVQAESVANENAPPNATMKLLLEIVPMAVSFRSGFLARNSTP